MTAHAHPIDVSEAKYLHRLESMAAALRAQLPTSRILAANLSGRSSMKMRSNKSAERRVGVLKRFTDLMVAERKVFGVIQKARSELIEHDTIQYLAEENFVTEKEALDLRLSTATVKHPAPARRFMAPLLPDPAKVRLTQ